MKRECRTEFVPIRFSPSEKRNVESLAKQEHDYLSAFCRRLILSRVTDISDGRKSTRG